MSEYREKNGYAPTLNEICDKFRLSSVSTAHYYINNLKNEGYLIKEENRPRAIYPVHQDEFIKIPIVGIISNSNILRWNNNSEDFVSISRKEYEMGGKYYALKVVGNSEEKYGIIDGDIIIIREEGSPDTNSLNQLLIRFNSRGRAIINGISKSGAISNADNSVQLSFPFESDEFKIQGVIIKVIRDLNYRSQDMTLAYKKRLFLESIRTRNPNSKNKYKRVALSPIRYAGGKSLAVGYVIELLPDNIRRVVSPFFGGGSIEIAMTQKLGLEVIGYEIFDILVNYWNYQINHKKELYERLKELKPDKQTFEKIRLILRDVWYKNIELDPLTLATYFVYNFNLSYGPGFMGWASNIYLNEKRYKKMIEYIRDFDPGNLKVECADFREVIPRYPNDFLYCDPPYYIGKDSKMFKGIYPMRNIPVHHVGFPHEELRDLLRKHKGGFILSYNDCPMIREYYKEYQQFFPKWQYTMGQGETRIGLNRKIKNTNHIKQSHEIIIYCPPRF